MLVGLIAEEDVIEVWYSLKLCWCLAEINRDLGVPKWWSKVSVLSHEHLDIRNN